MDDKEQIVRWYKDVVAAKIEWLWYPYIPCGKITILQGEPGCGKVGMMINIITKLTTGDTLPDGRRIDPINVIYLYKEDRWVDVIRPMLESTKVNMERVMHIKGDSLNNDLPKDAAIGFNARLLVIDSFHDFVKKTDLVNTARARSIMKRISGWAAENQCAVVLIENLNGKKRKNDLYRSFGSIEIMVIARSVIHVDRSKLEPQIRYLRHIKSNLTEESKEQVFKIDDKGRVDWLPSNEGNPIEKPDNSERNSRYEEV